ncbi:hypothetical protein N7582_003252 [Saccharomyces uvarum]|nr:hypothetical protein N7582_003252 [Saccharomyces uvarum]
MRTKMICLTLLADLTGSMGYRLEAHVCHLTLRVLMRILSTV